MKSSLWQDPLNEFQLHVTHFFPLKPLESSWFYHTESRCIMFNFSVLFKKRKMCILECIWKRLKFNAVFVEVVMQCLFLFRKFFSNGICFCLIFVVLFKGNFRINGSVDFKRFLWEIFLNTYHIFSGTNWKLEYFI